MSKPLSLMESAHLGMRQDEPRDRMRKGAVWNLIDYIPGVKALVQERGGWAYASPALSATVASSTYIPAVVYANFASGAKLCAWTDNNHLVTIASTSSATDIGTCAYPLQPPVLHAEKLVIPNNDGTSAVKYYDGSTLGSLAGSPPAAKYAAVFKDRTVLANTAAQPRRAYFSDAGDPTGWDTTNSYWSFSQPITGLAALPNVLMVFMASQTARLRGATPPPDTDFFADDPVFNIGCTDARSIAVNGSVACFANQRGVYLTNGTNIPIDLTKICGIKQYWKDLMVAATWTLAGGFLQNDYVLCVMNGSTFIDAFVFSGIDDSNYRVRRVANYKFLMLANAPIGGEELYAASRAETRVNSLSSTLSKTGTVKADGDGTAVTGVLETQFFQDDVASKTVRHVYLDYDVRDAASDNPTVTLAYITSPEASSYTTAGTFGESTTQGTGRVGVNKPVRGIGFKVTRTNASSDCRLYGLRAEIHGRERSRLN